MERLYRRYQDRGFTIIAISIDANIAAVEPFVKHLGITFPVGLDPKLVVANDYTVRALPWTGSLVTHRVGARTRDEAERV